MCASVLEFNTLSSGMRVLREPELSVGSETLGGPRDWKASIPTICEVKRPKLLTLEDHRPAKTTR